MHAKQSPCVSNLPPFASKKRDHEKWSYGTCTFSKTTSAANNCWAISDAAKRIETRVTTKYDRKLYFINVSVIVFSSSMEIPDHETHKSRKELRVN